MSQFIKYSSGDIYGPGPVMGMTGSLVTILDACLVDGYPGKPAAGWTKTFPNVSSSLACYKQPSGSRCTLFVNDAGAFSASLGKEVWATGWEQLYAMTSSTTANYTGSVGSGYGQFPTSAQLLAPGHTVWIKSTTNNDLHRRWILFADSYTFYLFVAPSIAGVTNPDGYSIFMFGDIYSYIEGRSDPYKCIINGIPTNNNPAASFLNSDVFPSDDSFSAYSQAETGWFIVRTFTGVPGSATMSRPCNIHYATNTSQNYCIMRGTSGISLDFGYWFESVNILDFTPSLIRGKLRGFVYTAHSPDQIIPGRLLSGSYDYCERVYESMNDTVNGASIFIEVSDTLDTN